MGINEEGKRKKKKSQAKKAASGLYKNADKRYLNSDNRYGEKKTAAPVVKENQTSESKGSKEVTSLHPQIEAKLELGTYFTIQYLVETPKIGIWGIVRELFPILEEGESRFKIKIKEIKTENSMAEDDDKIQLGQKLSIPVTAGNVYAFKKWKNDPAFRYYYVDHTQSLGEVVKDIYSYTNFNFANQEDRELLRSYFPYMVHDDMAKDKEKKMLEWNPEIIKKEGNGYCVDDKSPLVYKMEEEDVKIQNEANDFKNFKDYDKADKHSLPFAKLELELLERVMKKYGVKYADVYGNDITEEKFKENPFKESEIAHISTHGDGENGEMFKKDNRDKGNKESYIQTKEAFTGKYDNSKNRSKAPGSVTTSEIANMDFSSNFLVYYSACETAQDKNWTPEAKEHISMMEATLKAGAKNVIGNSWRVNDYVQPFMSYIFYNELLKDPERNVSKALRKSQLLLRTFFEDPKYWGSYQMLSLDYKKQDYGVNDRFNNELSSVKMNDASFEDMVMVDKWSTLAKHDKEFNVIWSKFLGYKDVINEPTSKPDEVSRAQLYLKASQMEILMYEGMLKEQDSRKRDTKEIQHKLKPDEGLVDIKRIDGEMGVQYVALITGHENKARPIPVVVNANQNYTVTVSATDKIPEHDVRKNNAEDRIYRLYKNQAKYAVQDDGAMYERSYEVFWARIQEELDRQKIKRIYLSSEGVYKEMSINVLHQVTKDKETNTTRADYVIDKIEIINLY